ncbi:MAG: efflux RND transporter periplasmic adaptor subunit [Bacteroidales bacterium]|jgi:cobalt-zinc-cadmium efflux system membrane fusion protein|nr:efflux RND transporter periplasmic adaptor subunit [Bacteroidales bacterium]
MKRVNSILLAVLAIMVVSCNQPKNNDAHHDETAENGHETEVSLTEKQLSMVGIQIGKIEQRDLNSVVKANGKMDLAPQMKADIHSLIGGIIKQISVVEGQKVRKGDVVAWLTNTEIVELQKNYLTLLKESSTAESEYHRQRELSQQGAGIEKTLQQASANYEIAKARLLGLKKQLEQLSIVPAQVESGNMVTQIPLTAPISGVVGKIEVTIGCYVDIQNPLMVVSDNSQIHCDLKVFEKDMPFIKIGQEVNMTLTNQNGAQLKGEVFEINQSFENELNAVIVHVKITNPNNLNLIPGMYVSALISTGKQKTAAVPNDAIVSSEGKKYIFQLHEKHQHDGENEYIFKRIEVITGVSELGYTQISPISPIDEQADIVISNAFYIASSMEDHGEHGH